MKNFWLLYEKVQCLFIFVILTPSIFLFEMFFVLPSLAETFQLPRGRIVIHIIISVFFFINVSGNMAMSILTDSTCKVISNNINNGWVFCEFCEENRPARSFHCKKCNKCVLKRDHHCFFFSTCIGYFNQRYYLLYLMHLFISMTYAFYYNCYFFSLNIDIFEFIFILARLLNPVVCILSQEPLNSKDFYVAVLIMNALLVLWSISLFLHHGWNFLNGGTHYEMKSNNKRYNLGWKQNVIQGFGKQWYLAILWPFVHSQLPGNGEDWIFKKE